MKYRQNVKRLKVRERVLKIETEKKRTGNEIVLSDEGWGYWF